MCYLEARGPGGEGLHHDVLHDALVATRVLAPGHLQGDAGRLAHPLRGHSHVVVCVGPQRTRRHDRVRPGTTKQLM